MIGGLHKIFIFVNVPLRCPSKFEIIGCAIIILSLMIIIIDPQAIRMN